MTMSSLVGFAGRCCLLTVMLLLAGGVLLADNETNPVDQEPVETAGDKPPVAKEPVDPAQFADGKGHGTGLDVATLKGYYCDSLSNVDDWYVVYSTSTLTGNCWDIVLTPSSGDPDLYAMWSPTVSSNPPQPFDSSNYECGRSRNSGTAVDSYNMCSHCCYTYGQIREYVVAYNAPTSFCVNNDWYTCSPGVKLASLTSRRTEGQIEVAWTVVSEPETAGYNVFRKVGENGKWVKVNEALVAASADRQYRITDHLADLGQVCTYRIEHVGLSGASEEIGTIVDRPLPPPEK